MNCNNTPKCKEPCGDCTQEWPRPDGAQSPAEGDDAQDFERWFEATYKPDYTTGPSFARDWAKRAWKARAARSNVQPKGTEDAAEDLRIALAQRNIAIEGRDREAAKAKAMRAALDFAAGAIGDAIYTEDGLDGDAGQRVLHIITEARELGTFDQQQFGALDHLCPFDRAEKAEAALAAVQSPAPSQPKGAEPVYRRRTDAEALDCANRLNRSFPPSSLKDEAADHIRELVAVVQAPAPAPDADPLFLLHCGQIDSSGEQDDWDIEADSGKRVEEFCRLHPGQTVNLYPHVQYPAVGADRAARAWAALSEPLIDEFLEDYEMVGEAEDGRDACHAPTEGERFLIKDAVMGLLQAALDHADASQPPVQGSES